MVPEQVKVLLSNHGVYLQDTVSISCAGTYNVNVDGKKTISYKKNDVFDVAAFAEKNTFDYITVEPETASDRIVLKNFENQTERHPITELYTYRKRKGISLQMRLIWKNTCMRLYPVRCHLPMRRRH